MVASYFGWKSLPETNKTDNFQSKPLLPKYVLYLTNIIQTKQAIES